MNSMIIWIVVLSLSYIQRSESVEFCDVEAIDNVFNVGNLIHFTRCGEVWTYDDRLRGGRGDFIRDYSFYSFARRQFHKNVEEKYGRFDDKYLHFAAFSIQEIECPNVHFESSNNCTLSAREWTHLSFVIDNKTAVLFKYDKDFVSYDGTSNPFQLNFISNVDTADRHPFWPDLDKIKGPADMHLPTGTALIHSTLYSMRNSRLYIVLLSSDAKYFCVTYINLRPMILRKDNWPTKDKKNSDFNWAQPNCRTGYVVGIFEYKSRVYIVGRIMYEQRVYEDQVYYVQTSDSSGSQSVQVDFGLKKSDQNKRYYENLRTMFGCPISEPKEELKPIPGKKKKKRSVDQTEYVLDFSYDSLLQELKDDWFQLSLMSVAALILIIIIIRLSKI